MFHSYTHCSTTTGSTTLTVNQMPNHAHQQQVSAAVGGSGVRTDYVSDAACSAYPQGISTGDVGGGGSHSHSISRSSTTTGSTGSGTSVDVLNPYYVVYTWTRTA